jgi:hypothetical protein
VAQTELNFITQDLLIFFRSRCARPELIKDVTSNARHLCGYDGNLPGWRLLSDTISLLPHIHSYGYWLRPTDMDGLRTIAQIADKLTKTSRRRPANFNAALRTGKAGFLAMDSERVDKSSIDGGQDDQ